MAPFLAFLSFGLFTKYSIRDSYVWIIAIISVLITYILNKNSVQWLGGYVFGFELLPVNGLITFLGLWLIKLKNKIINPKILIFELWEKT